ILPISLQPLTYLCPAELEGKASIGMAVSVPLKGKTAYGVISGINNSVSEIKNLKEIISIIGDSPLLTKRHLELINWISGYYHCENGLVLKGMIPDEILKAKKISKTRKKTIKKIKFVKSDISLEQLDHLMELINTQGYKTTLVQCDSSIHEISIVIELIKDVKKVIILCPEIEQAEFTSLVIEHELKRRVIIVHSGLSPNRVVRAYDEIINADEAIVCGTLSASIVPLGSPQLFIVMNEHSPYYKQERHPRINARDIIVRRGFMEGAPVVLMSSSPSAISYHNCLIGKYDYYDMSKDRKTQNIIIENMFGIRNIIKKSIYPILQKSINSGSSSLIYINKKGYSLLICADCGSIIKCPNCETPLMFFEDKIFHCSGCGFQNKAVSHCPKCRGVTFDNIGSGIQRIERLIHQKTGLLPVRIDSSLLKTEYQKAVKEALLSPIVVSTRIVSRTNAFIGHFDNIIYVNTDINFTFVDYLSNERLYQEIKTLIEMLKDTGRIYIQTRFPQSDVFTALKTRDYKGFAINELNKRKELLYPPFSKMASLVFYYNGDEFPFEIPESINEVSVLGPIRVFYKHSGYSNSVRIILRSRERNLLNQAVISLKKLAGSHKLYLDIDIY
ncbi:MAG: hypothetical protein HQK93_05880, partial [Nitrospirae bacterium]|nr:hypothetical protein [Nitrospirota bacterium]